MNDEVMAAFARELLCTLFEDFDGFFGDEWSEEVCQIMEKYGMVSLLAYDPAKHGEIDMDPGDPVWIFCPEINAMFEAHRLRKYQGSNRTPAIPDADKAGELNIGR